MQYAQTLWNMLNKCRKIFTWLPQQVNNEKGHGWARPVTINKVNMGQRTTPGATLQLASWEISISDVGHTRQIKLNAPNTHISAVELFIKFSATVKVRRHNSAISRALCAPFLLDFLIYFITPMKFEASQKMRISRQVVIPMKK